MMEVLQATLTTDASGNCTVYVGSRIRGRVHALRWQKGGILSAPMVISGETTGVMVLAKTLAADGWMYPVAPATKTTDGTASTLTEVPVYLVDERLQVTISGGTASQSGVLTVFVDC